MEGIKNLKVNMEQKILESEKVVIVPHNNVDFDAIGSAIGISLISKKFKKPSYIVVNDPSYKIDYGVQLIIEEAGKDYSIINRDRYMQITSPEDLFILTDVNKSNLISLNDQIKRSDKTIIIDHHNEDNQTLPSDEKYIDIEISSASEVVAKLLSMYRIRLTPDVANYLLAGIYLDTNKLSKNVSPETMRIVARLLESGANLNRVTDLFTEDFISDRRVQELVSRASIITFSIATAVAEEGIEYTREELAKAADYLLKYKVDAAFALGNIENNVISISARSKEKVNVGVVMQELEGGGNQFSGATKLHDCTIEQAKQKLIKAIQPHYYVE